MVRDQMKPDDQRAVNADMGNGSMFAIQRFQMLADRNPDRIAAVDADHEISYGALDVRSNRLAHYLIDLGMGRGSIACTHLPPGLGLMVAILAIAKTGGAFLTIDPELPNARKRLMIEDCKPRVTIGSIDGDWYADCDAARVDLDRDSATIESHDPGRPESRIVRGGLAYLFYTSGSTGDPKAVMVPWNTQAAPAKRIPCPGENDRHVLKSSPAFTLIVREIFQPITSGGRVYLLPEGRNGDPDALLDSIIANCLSLITVVPSVLRALLVNPKLPQCRSLRFIDCIGESLPPALRIAFQERLPVPLGVTYGCTEASSATSRVFNPGDDCDRVDLGKQHSNRSIYILDEYLNPVPEGGSGQIYVGGELSTGYFKRPRLTAERFIPDPHSPISGARMYGTGDHGRFSADGSLIYLGREDDQVQINGQRVEPAEVEKAIAAHDTVAQAVVMICGTPAQPYLVAFVTSRTEGLTVPILSQYSRSRLPLYMVPARFILLASMPLLPSGKLDRGSLLDSLEYSKQPLVDPANDTEDKIFRIWSDLLGRGDFGVTEEFFEMGADSLMAAQLIHQINDTFGVSYLPEHLTEGTTVRSMAAVMNSDRASTPGNVVCINKAGKQVPFIAVHGEGNIFFYGRLARLLGPSRPFYAIQASGLNHIPLRYKNLQDCAADYVRQIRHNLPSGPYVVGGYCFGAVIAFEMVQQLQNAGQSVPLLVIFDTGPADTRFSADEDQRISDEIRAALSRVRTYYEKMVREYDPKPYPGGAVLIQSARLRVDLADRPALKRILDRVSGGYEIHRVDDQDCSMFENPCVDDVAKIVNESLAANSSAPV